MPSWPTDVPYLALAGSWSMPEPGKPPIESEMEGGNTRRRRRPGDNVAQIQFQIPMTRSEFDLFLVWYRADAADNGASNGAARFTMSVWLGSGYSSKTVQFAQGFVPSASEHGLDILLQMKLQVFGV